MYARCPHCRQRLWVGDSNIDITPRQKDILRAIPDLARSNRNGVATTAAIASHVGWSVRTVQYELLHLEHVGEVRRHRQKSGWTLLERPVMMVA